uniref:Uncharacterized protein n=1 Tax=Helianthus annuus TaxID=4232 RepID=A0A251UJ97_HELAN
MLKILNHVGVGTTAAGLKAALTILTRPNHNCTLWGSTLWGRMGSCQRGGDPAYIDQFTLPKLVVAIKLMLADPEMTTAI